MSDLEILDQFEAWLEERLKQKRADPWAHAYGNYDVMEVEFILEELRERRDMQQRKALCNE